MLYYVMTSCTSWVQVEKAVVSGPYAAKDIAWGECAAGEWPELMTEEQAKALTY